MSVPDVQLVQFISENYPAVSNGKFTLSFGPVPGVLETTSSLSYLSSASNVRSELSNLGYSNGIGNNFSFSTFIGDLDVARSPISGAGYQWEVTFLGSQNEGDHVLLTGRAGAARGEEVLISKLVVGQRAGGQSETQLITIQATDASGDNTSAIIKSLSGYFRLSFDGSMSNTAWLPITASASQVARALSQLDTIR